MFDLGWPEMLTILAVALIVIGPKDLPKALYTVGKWVRAARKMTGEFQRHVDDMVRETELEEVKKAAQTLSKGGLKRELEKTIDPKGELRDSLAPPKELNDLGRLTEDDRIRRDKLSRVEKDADEMEAAAQAGEASPAAAPTSTKRPAGAGSGTATSPPPAPAAPVARATTPPAGASDPGAAAAPAGDAGSDKTA